MNGISISSGTPSHSRYLVSMVRVYEVEVGRS